MSGTRRTSSRQRDHMPRINKQNWLSKPTGTILFLTADMLQFFREKLLITKELLPVGLRITRPILHTAALLTMAASMLSHIFVCWKGATSTALLSLNWKPDVKIRFAFMQQTWDILFVATWNMEMVTIQSDAYACMLICFVSTILSIIVPWNLRQIFPRLSVSFSK